MYHRMNDDEVLAAGGRPPALAEPRPLVLHIVEEVDDVSLALSALQEQVIVPATLEVPMASSALRAVQPVGVELPLTLPGLDNVWFEDWTFHEHVAPCPRFSTHGANPSCTCTRFTRRSGFWKIGRTGGGCSRT